MATAADTPQTRSVTPSGGATTPFTLTPSAYERNVDNITPEHTTLTNSRERFVVLALSALLLFISGSLFGILLTLLSDDLSFIPTVITASRASLLLQVFIANHVLQISRYRSPSQALLAVLAGAQHLWLKSAAVIRNARDLKKE
ncbi:hypothetical protein MTO96_025566 [Rhipicephalus appendiculatus]